MPNQFLGQVVDTNGQALGEVTVTITGPDVEASTTTDSEGKWLITLEKPIDPALVTVTFSKSDFELKSIKNPQPTSTLNKAPELVSINYTYLGRYDGDTIYVDVRDNLKLIGERKFSNVTYTIDSAVATMKDEGDKFGFSFDGTFYPPQNPTQST
jgi:hypothetical protein